MQSQPASRWASNRSRDSPQAMLQRIERTPQGQQACGGLLMRQQGLVPTVVRESVPGADLQPVGAGPVEFGAVRF